MYLTPSKAAKFLGISTATLDIMLQTRPVAGAVFVTMGGQRRINAELLAEKWSVAESVPQQTTARDAFVTALNTRR
jgi:hypothetical protein